MAGVKGNQRKPSSLGVPLQRYTHLAALPMCNLCGHPGCSKCPTLGAECGTQPWALVACLFLLQTSSKKDTFKKAPDCFTNRWPDVQKQTESTSPLSPDWKDPAINLLVPIGLIAVLFCFQRPHTSHHVYVPNGHLLRRGIDYAITTASRQ